MSRLIRNNRRHSAIYYKKVEDTKISEMRKYVGAYLFAWDDYSQTPKARAKEFKSVQPSVILKITGTLDGIENRYILKAIYGIRERNISKENQGYISSVPVSRRDWFITNDMKHIKETANKYGMSCYI
jgi:hypothetical protein